MRFLHESASISFSFRTSVFSWIFFCKKKNHEIHDKSSNRLIKANPAGRILRCTSHAAAAVLRPYPLGWVFEDNTTSDEKRVENACYSRRQGEKKERENKILRNSEEEKTEEGRRILHDAERAAQIWLNLINTRRAQDTFPTAEKKERRKQRWGRCSPKPVGGEERRRLL